MIQNEIVQKSCVLLGFVGSGKTTLFNKICGKNNITKYGGKSLTQQVFQANCQYESGLQILDTPGFGIHDDKYKHAIKQLTGLIALPLNSILLCVKFDRIDIMRDYIKKCIQPLKDYKNMITLIVTYWDLSQDQKQDELDLQEKVFSYFEIHNYILVSLQTDGEYISEKIQKQMLKMPVQIQMNEIEFIKKFDFVDQNYDLEKAVYKVNQEFEDMSSAVMTKTNQILRENQDDQKLDEILHTMSIWIKQQAQNLFEGFQKQYGHIMNEQFLQSENAQFSYICHTKLKYDIFTKLENITEFIYDKMRLKRDHPLNYIRECNHCGLIWLKVDGCDDMTTCGQQLPQTDNIMKAQTNNLKIEIQYKDKKIYLIFKYDEQQKRIQKLIKQKDQLSQQFRQQQIERTNLEQKIDLKRGISLFFSILTLGILNLHKFELRSVQNQISHLQEKIQEFESEIEQQQEIFNDQWQIKNQNQQNLKGCGQQIRWSDLKIPTHLLQQLTQDQILDFLKETQEGVKFSEKFKTDLDQSIKDIQKQ